MRRVVVVGRAYEGGGRCTMVLWRNSQDGIVVSLDSTWKAAVKLSPEAFETLMDGLGKLSG